MSNSQYAKTRRADPKAIRRQIDKGVIKLVDGRNYSYQAGASWAPCAQHGLPPAALLSVLD